MDRRRTLSPALAFAFVLAGSAPLAQAADLTVDLADVGASGGTLHVALLDSPAAWNQQARPIAAQAASAQPPHAQVVFRDVAPGPYALMVFQDTNGNGRLDTNIAGLPLEPYGFSNNPVVMRKPTFEEARFSVPAEGAHVTVNLR